MNRDQDSPALLEQYRLLVEQQRVWDDLFFTSGEAKGGPPAAASRPVALKAEPPKAESVPAARTGDKQTALEALYDRYKDCQACPLGATRIKFVFGVGNPETPVLFIGEGPGYEEDRKGEPFVGKAGQLLDRIMAAIGLNRQNSYIANIVKCHPMKDPTTPEARGNDRAPEAAEVEACSPILREQIAIIQPKFVVTLGAPSTRTILATSEGITKLRGQLRPFPVEVLYPLGTLPEELRETLSKIQVLPTYHPAALLRNEMLKGDVWTDMKRLRDLLQSAKSGML